MRRDKTRHDERRHDETRRDKSWQEETWRVEMWRDVTWQVISRLVLMSTWMKISWSASRTTNPLYRACCQFVHKEMLQALDYYVKVQSYSRIPVPPILTCSSCPPHSWPEDPPALISIYPAHDMISSLPNIIISSSEHISISKAKNTHVLFSTVDICLWNSYKRDKVCVQVFDTFVFISDPWFSWRYFFISLISSFYFLDFFFIFNRTKLFGLFFDTRNSSYRDIGISANWKKKKKIIIRPITYFAKVECRVEW